jgi:hypothetical protein
MFREHDIVTLTAAIPDNGVLHIPSVKSGNSGRALIPGDIGTIVHIYPGREAFTVEFDGPDIYTAAIADILATQIRATTEYDLANDRFRPRTEKDIANFREWKKSRA